MAAQKRAKTETLSLRLDPKTKFMLDFLARVQGQSITTVVERAVREVASGVGISGDFDQTLTWAQFWDASEGVRTLKLFAETNYPTNFEEDELLSFARTHWQFFYTNASKDNPRQSYVEILWPNIERYLDIWRSCKQTNYWAAGQEMEKDLLAAKIAPPDWPGKMKPKPTPPSFSADLDDEIPF